MKAVEAFVCRVDMNIFHYTNNLPIIVGRHEIYTTNHTDYCSNLMKFIKSV